MDKFNSIITNISKVIPVIYIMGFTVISAHWSKYGFSDFEILNATYIKAGILITLILSCLFLAVYYSYSKETMTDDLKKSWPSKLIVIYNICFLTILFTPLFTDIKGFFEERNVLTIIFFVSFIIHAFFRVWTMGKTPKNNFGLIFLIVAPIILILPAIITLIIKDNQILYLFVFLFIIGHLMSLALGDFGDGNYRGRIITDIAVLLATCYIFGYIFYENIPSKFGGGQPYTIEFLKPTEINDSIPKNEKAQVIYENSSRLLLKNPNNEMFFVLKSEIKSYKIIQTEQ